MEAAGIEPAQGRTAQEPSAATALLVVDHELISRQRIRERHVAEEVALAEELYAVAFVVVGVGRSFRSRRHRRARLSAGPADSSPTYLVASPKTSRPLRLRPAFAIGPSLAGAS
jgi:hypothetical protein